MDTRISVIDKRLSNIKNVISVASGKGGVGKSLIASSLALILSKKGYKVGLLDLDLYGPSSHIILGVKNVLPEEEKGIIPPKVNNICFMSIVYFTEDKPSPFRGIDVSNIIIELLAITQWGRLDYLVIDMPPGIGDETLDVIRLIKKSRFLVVTTPSKVSMAAVGKLLTLLKELKLPIVGVVENMKMNNSGYVKNIVSKERIRYLGSIPFDTKIEEAIGDPLRLYKTSFMKKLEDIVLSNNIING
ncbi:MAG: ATP-binding protein [Thermoplasmata archaeon]|nr:MAG: ATP-binding protein [Thermoplasmata archaeon]RLF52415.1 MAG: ATP-binding protein [Thermoplasmata archaeon]